MEKKRLEVILDAQNHAEGAMRQFGTGLNHLVDQANRVRSASSRAFREGAESLSQMSGGSSIAGRAMQFLGGAIRSPILGLVALGNIATGVLSSLAGAVLRLGQTFLSVLGNMLQSILNRAIQAFTAFGLAATAALGLAAKQAAEFGHGMRYVNSIMQLSEAGFGAISQQVKEMAQSVGVAPAILARGLYDVASSGFKGAEGLQVLAAAAKAGVAGLSDTATAARAVISVLNAYGLGASEAGRISDIMFKGVDIGIFTFGDLAGTLGTVVASAAAAKISFTEIMAAFASMTKAGVDASETSTALNRIIVSFLSPGKEFAAALQAIGIESGAAHIQLQGLVGAVKALNQIAGDNPIILADMGLESRALKAALSLTRDEGRAFASDLAAMGQASGATDRALSQIDMSLARLWERMKVGAQVMLVSLGEAFGPALETLVSGATSTFQQLTAVLVDVSQSDRFQAFVVGISAALEEAGATIGAWITWLAENWEQIWDWVATRASTAADYIAGSIGGIIAVIQQLYASRGAIWDWARELMQAFLAVGQSIYSSVVTRIEGLLKVVKGMAPWVAGALAALKAIPTGMAVGGALGGVPGAIGGGAIAGAAGFGTGYGITKGIEESLVPAIRKSLEKIGPSAVKEFDKLRAEAAKNAPGAILNAGETFQAGSRGMRDRLAAFLERITPGKQEGQSAAERAAGWERVGPGAWLVPQDPHAVEMQKRMEEASGRQVQAAGLQSDAAKAQIAAAAKNLGAAAKTAELMAEVMARANEKQSGFGPNERIQRWGLMARAAGATGDKDVELQALTEQAIEKAEITRTLRSKITPESSLAAFENYAVAEEQLRQMYQSIGERVGKGGGVHMIGEGSQTKGGPESWLSGRDYIAKEMARRAETERYTQWEQMDADRAARAASAAEFTGTFGGDIARRRRGEAFGPADGGAGVTVLQINIGQVNSKDQLLAAVTSSVEQFWTDQIDLESQRQGY